MGNTESILKDILNDAAPTSEIFDAVRERRDEVLKLAGRFPGALRTYVSGSIAHRTANGDMDADCDMVLDRRFYPGLGPDGEDVGPSDIVEQVRIYLREEMKTEHPNIAFRVTKRAIKITFNETLDDGTDPTVDLIVALTRKELAGLWIPNLEQSRWDPSHPECHTDLMTAEPANLRRNRQKVVRLAKIWAKQYSRPGLCSFNLTALALACIEERMGIATGLNVFFWYAAKDLKRHLTLDPAGVSPSIKLLDARDTVVHRLKRASNNIESALANDDDQDAVLESLSNLFPKYVTPPAGSSSKAAFANNLRNGNPAVSVFGGTALGVHNATPIKNTRAYGGTHWQG